MHKDAVFSRRRFLQISGAGILGMEFLRSGGHIFLTPDNKSGRSHLPHDLGRSADGAYGREYTFRAIHK